MAATITLFSLLLALEWLFWLSPFRPAFDKWTRLLGHKYFLFPFHYLARLLILAGVLLAWRPHLWPLFRGGVNLGWSLLLGGLLILLTYPLYLKMGNMNSPAFVDRALVWHRTNPRGFWCHTAYLTIYPGLVEELLFRWFFPAILWPVLSWWTILVAPLINLVWHLPVWVDFVRQQPGGLRDRAALLLSIAGPATAFAAALTVIPALTENIAGAVIAHAFGDWAGTAMRSTHQSQQSAA